ncbi:hypothetical protein [Dolichospermum compactum]|uniref:Uncharacterized protein n=1 Tax=Dolichospermum compactum NIES-806 TaxID=1973481 RepID=A0A1Z4V546_9CYAN|nr:hypothetical protein [Dolichospermum compactum]BAZ86564.1 hypothetical protein NIES806_27770 [Dolichospermum compactum NIES-806]
MSSDSSHRYQSKLFNFVYQYSRRLTQTLETTFKNLQFATGSGVGSLLYPLYQLWQQNGTVKKLQSATPPTSDAPIQIILDVVKNLPPGETYIPTSSQTNPLTFLGSLSKKIFPQPNSPTPESTLQQHIPTVQGIAIELQTRNLVLVSADNRIFDVFTPQQNIKLADRINSEISEYRYSLQLIAHQQQELLPKIDDLFNKLTDEDSIIAQKSLLNPLKLFSFLDKLVANLEDTALVPVQKRSQEIVNNFQNQVQGLAVNNDELKPHKPQISDLIAAAINYFFGGRNIYQIDSNSSTEKPDFKKVLSSNNQLNFDNSSGDNWLSWNDLFGETNTNIQESVQQPQAKREFPDIHRQISQQASEPKNEEFPEIDSKTSQGFNFKPDWIDISATSLGYEKHPLEQILEWLDQVILWIEQILTNMLYFFRGLLLGR